MYMRTGCFLIAAVLCLLVSGMKWDGGEAALAAVIKVTPANVQASIDKLPESTADSDKPRSLQAIMADSATYAGDDDDEDVIEFAPGTYDDVGELLVTRPLTLRKDPVADGDAVITGELLIQIRSRDVKVEDLTFRDLEIGDVTILRDGERGHGTPPNQRAGPVVTYLGDVTAQSFLLDRKAKVSAWQAENGCSSDRASCPSCPSDGSMPDCAHDYSSYTGQLHRTELAKHLDSSSAARFEFYPPTLITNKETGIPMEYSSGNNSRFDTGADRWDFNGRSTDQPWVRDSLGHILINPRWNPSDGASACPASEAFTGLEITRNSFDGTEVRAIHSLTGGDWIFRKRAGATDCTVDIRIVGNTFRNIGVADYAYLTARDENGVPRTDSAGNPVFIMDEDGNRIPFNNEDEYAIGLWDVYRKVTISDNRIEGVSLEPLWIHNLVGSAEVTVSNNLVRGFTAGGNRVGNILIQIGGALEDTKITVSGNRVFRSDSDPDYNIVYYESFFGRAKWCAHPDDLATITDSTTIAQLDRSLQPAIMQSYVPNFPYPPLSSGDVVDAGEGTTIGPSVRTPVRLTKLARPSATVGDFDIGDADDGILKSDDIMIGKYDIVRYRNCFRKRMIYIGGHEDAKVSVVGNDIGYGEGAAPFDIAIALDGIGGFEAFSGNNIDNYVSSLMGGGFSGSLATKGNYIGPIPRVSRSVTLDRAGELSEPVAREPGTVGPRAGMNADSPPVVPRIASASVSPTAGNMVVVTYDTSLARESVPPASAFAVRYRVEDGRSLEIGVSGLSVSGMTVTLTLASEIPSGASGVTVVYTAPGGDAAVRSRLGSVAARNQSSPVTTGNGGPGPGEPPPVDQPGGGGDGGCVLASSESGGADLGTLLFLTVVVSFAFTAGRKRRYNA